MHDSYTFTKIVTIIHILKSSGDKKNIWDFLERIFVVKNATWDECSFQNYNVLNVLYQAHIRRS